MTPATPIAEETERLEAPPVLLAVEEDEVALEEPDAFEPEAAGADLGAEMTQYLPKYIQRWQLTRQRKCY